ncbi:N-acetyltransferase [Nocardioides oleivorans]|uniref:N-acetyltransferase n=1 Tax=Nocardioides oleivorans TaxID=273676 RepID=A0A4Q2RYF4_9ACTN|nr:GNAT family protein [Nocardioides oleivorans]RYB92969.1 N-acetyltransferase [Nocardioides oleivorans]
MSGLAIAPLSREHALDICAWRYDPPYSSYDMTGADPDWLLDPASGFHAVLSGDELVGFRSYGEDGRVPGWEYDDRALDTGGGLRPSLTGRGLGPVAVAVGLAHGRAAFAPPAFRVTVASFNARALRVVEGLGFSRVGRFASTHDGQDFEVLVRPEP